MPVSIDDYTEHDQRIWDEELAEFVPSRVFDAHIHMLNRAHFPTFQTPPRIGRTLIFRSCERGPSDCTQAAKLIFLYSVRRRPASMSTRTTIGQSNRFSVTRSHA